MSTIDKILPDSFDEIFQPFRSAVGIEVLYIRVSYPYPRHAMKLGLKLMASVCSDCMDTEREFLNHIINKLNGIYLIVTRIDFQRPDPGCIINGCILGASSVNCCY
jgi:hypothetical protein